MLRLLGQFLQTCSIGRKQRGHAVDKGPCTAGTGAVHPLIDTISQVSDFFVFTAQFNDDIGVRNKCADRFGLRKDFLIKRNLKAGGKSHTAAAGDGSGDPVTGESFLDFVQCGKYGFLYFRHMPHIRAPEQLFAWRKHCCFDCGRSDIYTHMKYWVHNVSLLNTEQLKVINDIEKKKDSA